MAEGRRGIIGVMTDVTQILSQIESGDPSAAEQLLPLVYEELRKLAAAKLAQEKPGQTLQATALVHEAYLRLVDVEKAQHWNSRGHFFAAAAEAMRRILVEPGTRQGTPKARGPEAARSIWTRSTWQSTHRTRTFWHSMKPSSAWQQRIRECAEVGEAAILRWSTRSTRRPTALGISASNRQTPLDLRASLAALTHSDADDRFDVDVVFSKIFANP